MKRIISLLSVIFSMVFFVACGPMMITKAEKFPLLYEEQPSAILILPPINETTAADAKEYYSTTIQEPLAFAGYYTLPYPITSDILKMEGVYDTELLLNTNLSKFREYFGADAVLYTIIKKWNLSYVIIASNLTIEIECILKSTLSDQILWEYTGTVVVDLSGGNTGGGLAGLIAKVIVTALSSAMADYVPYARQANYHALSSIPHGKYHPQHNKDRNVEFIDQKPKQSSE